MLADRMKASRFAYEFEDPPDPSGYRHEQLPLDLLAFHNRARASGPSRASGASGEPNQHYLRRYDRLRPEMTLASVTNRSRYTSNHWSNPEYAIQGGWFFLKFVVAATGGIKFRHPNAPANSPPVFHTCQSAEFYRLMSYDHWCNAPGVLDDSPIQCDGCDQYSDADTPDESRTRPATPVENMGSLTLEDAAPAPSAEVAGRAGRAIRARSPTLESALTSRNVRRRLDTSRPRTVFLGPGLHRTESLPSLAATFMPVKLNWDRPFIPPNESLEPAKLSLSLVDFRDSYYEAAWNDVLDAPDFFVRGSDIAELTDVFKDLIRQSVTRGDFTDILSNNRFFSIQAAGPRDQYGPSPVGIGLEVEVVTRLRTHLQDNLSIYFRETCDDLFVIDTPPLLTPISSEVRYHLGTLGAIVALCILHGIPLPKIDGAWLIYLIYDCHFDALTYNVVKEYHEHLAGIVKQLNDIGPEGDLSPFAQHLELYAGIKADQFRIRDNTTHAALAATLLYHAVLGTQPPSHPYVRAFRAGFDLPCRNGLTFSKAARRYTTEIGETLEAAALIRSCTSLRIDSYGAIKDYLEVSVVDLVGPPEAREGALQLPGFDRLVSLEDIFHGFLQRTGIPCPTIFAEKREAGVFSEQIPLEDINHESFRARMFAMAIASTDSIRSDSKFKVMWVGDESRLYGIGSDDARQAFRAAGRIQWQTCIQTCVIPASYLLTELAGKTYTAESEPKSLVEAIDNWLLLEILSTISIHGGII
ncbi:hypothetical protein K474DRAFT_743508 [Panus rudis PR-1116 ss-1]|nr:hypothetical protein K474DRAFT_743508 [Panus rudis PR-1116 ss-1]